MNKRTKKEISEDLNQVNSNYNKLSMEIAEDSTEYDRTKYEGLLRSLNYKIQACGDLFKKIQMLDQELKEAIE